MTRLPREPLDADERAIAAQLPRLHGRSEPDAAMDARILAAAHAAVSSPVAKRRRGWIVPLTAAASVSLAIGLAWQLQPPPAPQGVPSDAAGIAAGAASEQDSATADRVEAPGEAPPATPANVMSPPAAAPAMQRAAPVTESARIAREAAAVEPAQESVAAAPMFVPSPAPVVTADALPVASAPPLPPPAPPAPPAAQAAMARSSGTLDSVTVGGAAVREPAKRVRNEAEAAADAAASEHFVSAADEEDVPPATMNAPAARDAWLRRIGELQQQGRIDDAKASLAEFRRRYPDAVLPAELRKLEP